MKNRFEYFWLVDLTELLRASWLKMTVNREVRARPS